MQLKKITEKCGQIMLIWQLKPLCITCLFIEARLKYFIDITKKCLGFFSDSLIESMHQYLDKLMCKSNYHVKNVEAEIQGEKLLQAVKHLNAYNLE